MKKKIAILGSTSSIGKSLLSIIKNDKKKFEIKLLTANTNYKDLIYGKILKKLKIKKLKKDSFINYMKSINKLGGQNKVPRLSNDRKIVEKLEQYLN